jgi:hypothetical protein
MGALTADYPNRKYANLKCHDPAIGPGWGGTYLVRKLLQVAPTLGIEIYTETEGVHLIQGEDGKICGVLAKDPGGEVEVSAKASSWLPAASAATTRS